MVGVTQRDSYRWRRIILVVLQISVEHGIFSVSCDMFRIIIICFGYVIDSLVICAQ